MLVRVTVSRHQNDFKSTVFFATWNVTWSLTAKQTLLSTFGNLKKRAENSAATWNTTLSTWRRTERGQRVTAPKPTIYGQAIHRQRWLGDKRERKEERRNKTLTSAQVFFYVSPLWHTHERRIRACLLWFYTRGWPAAQPLGNLFLCFWALFSSYHRPPVGWSFTLIDSLLVHWDR